MAIAFEWPAAATLATLAIGLWATRFLPSGILLAILLAIAAGTFRAEQIEATGQSVPLGGDLKATGRILTGSQLTRTGQRFVVSLMFEDSNVESRLCVYAPAQPDVATGDRIEATGVVTDTPDLSSAGRAAMESRGCAAQWRVSEVIILSRSEGLNAQFNRIQQRLSGFLIRAAPGDGGALMSGLVTGDDGALSNEAQDAFLATGTTHITAISGANFATILVAISLAAGRAARRRSLYVFLAAAILWAYALMVGMTPSAVRACLLATGVLIGVRLGRRPDLLTLTVVLTAVQVAIRPGDLQSLAFQLSFAATLALVLVFSAPRLSQLRPLPSLVMAVIAAQLATIPILMATVGVISPASLLVNLLVGPLAAVAFPLSLAAASIGMFVPEVGESIAVPGGLIADFIVWITIEGSRILPAPIETGEGNRGAIAVVAMICLLLVLWMSPDARMMRRALFERLQE